MRDTRPGPEAGPADSLRSQGDEERMGGRVFCDDLEGDQYFLGIVRFKVGSAEPHPPVG